jgi:hypothetical protein
MRLHGWHSGFEHEEATGYMRELSSVYREALPERERIARLAQLLTRLQMEAAKLINGVAVVWHPGISLTDVEAATPARVIALAPETIRDAMAQWDEIKAGWLNSEGVLMDA